MSRVLIGRCLGIDRGSCCFRGLPWFALNLDGHQFLPAAVKN